MYAPDHGIYERSAAPERQDHHRLRVLRCRFERRQRRPVHGRRSGRTMSISCAWTLFITSGWRRSKLAWTSSRVFDSGTFCAKGTDQTVGNPDDEYPPDLVVGYGTDPVQYLNPSNYYLVETAARRPGRRRIFPESRNKPIRALPPIAAYWHDIKNGDGLCRQCRVVLQRERSFGETSGKSYLAPRPSRNQEA